MYRLLTSTVRSFAIDERGNVAVMFALMSTVILLVAGIAIDFARTVRTSSRIGAAADAATLAAGRAMLDGKLNDAEVRKLANSFLRHNAEAGGTMSGEYAQPTITLNRDLGSVRVDVGVTVPTTLTRITGHKEMNAPVSTAALFEQKDVEVAMALDVTGSMTENAGGRQRKIDGLKFAFRRFVEKLIPEHKADGRKVRVAVAPYSSGVNMGAFAKGASGNRSRDNCVIERTGQAHASDAPVGAGSYFKVHEDQPKDTDNTEGRQDYTCPNAKIIPLTDNRSLLTTTVDGYKASGSTGGHLGVQWAWNLVSEDWGSFWGPDSRPDPYARAEGGKDAELVKAVILMTDGVFNTSFYNGSSSQQATTLCRAMRDKNVLVFSIAFGDPPSQAKRTLEECATPGEEYYADAANTEELDGALSRFAGTLTKLRLSR
jgi:Flp pilus assembly protein TadG